MLLLLLPLLLLEKGLRGGFPLLPPPPLVLLLLRDGGWRGGLPLPPLPPPLLLEAGGEGGKEEEELWRDSCARIDATRWMETPACVGCVLCVCVFDG